MEPISLRTLTVLLNYERMISDTRFEGVELHSSSIVDPLIIQNLRRNYPYVFANEPATIEERRFNVFLSDTTPPTSETPSAICCIHPDADPEVKALTFAQRELIYHEGRGHDGCYNAIGLFQFFFNLCPPGQKFSIQIMNEEPLIVYSQPCQIFEFKVKGPKFHSIASIPSKPLTLYTGNREGENHGVLGFPHPDKPEQYLVVDMTRMQYGSAGRGLYGEYYFLGTLESYVSSMGKICEGLIDVGHGASYMEMESSETEARLIRCAKRVWERWQNREKEGWCEHCGKGGSNLKKCSGCKRLTIRYCCKEHQVAGWKLHKHSCEKKRT